MESRNKLRCHTLSHSTHWKSSLVFLCLCLTQLVSSEGRLGPMNEDDRDGSHDESLILANLFAKKHSSQFQIPFASVRTTPSTSVVEAKNSIFPNFVRSAWHHLKSWWGSKKDGGSAIPGPDSEDFSGPRSERLVAESDDPWMPYYLSIKMNGKHICSAALLTEKLAITVASCFLNEANEQVPNDEVRVVHNRCKTRSSAINKVVLHHDYDYKNLVHDLAVVHLAEGFKFERGNLDAIALPTDIHQEYIGRSAIASGAKRITGEHVNEFLKIITNDECGQELGEDIQRSMICTEDSSSLSDAYHGWPLVIKTGNAYELIGLYSEGTSAKVYTRISSHIKWIQGHIEVSKSDQGQVGATTFHLSNGSRKPQFVLKIYTSSRLHELLIGQDVQSPVDWKSASL